MSAEEFAFLSELYEVDPWGSRRSDLSIASLQADIRNMFRAKGSRPTMPVDLMPFERLAPSPEEVAAKGKALALYLIHSGRGAAPNGDHR